MTAAYLTCVTAQEGEIYGGYDQLLWWCRNLDDYERSIYYEDASQIITFSVTLYPLPLTPYPLFVSLDLFESPAARCSVVDC